MDETPEAATARECLEEVGLAVTIREKIRETVHRYPHGVIELNYFLCELIRAEDDPAEDSGFRWVPANDLPTYRFPEANEPVIEELVARSASSLNQVRHER